MLLQGIVNSGITVVTLGDGREYTKESLRSDSTALLVSIIVMFRAHEESKIKGERVRAAWTKKKLVDAKDGKPITNMTPRWLKVVDGKLEVIEEKATVIRRVFDLATKEGMGQRAICSAMNREGLPTTGDVGKKWTETTVRRVLLNPAVMGWYQPFSHRPDGPVKRVEEGDPIQDYYPVVIAPEQFFDAQRLRKDALIPRGPKATSGANTFFTGLVFCGNCGDPMIRKGASKFDVFDRLRCKGYCGMPSWKAKPLEAAVKMVLASDLLPHVRLKNSDRKTFQGRVTEAKARLLQASSGVGNLMKAIEAGADYSPALQKALKEAETREAGASREVAAATRALADMELRDATIGTHEEAISGLVKAMKDDEDGNVRDRLRYALGRTVDRIVLEEHEDTRTARLEIGNQVRFIDFSKETLEYSLRGVMAIAPVAIKNNAGKMIVVIP